MWEWNKKLFLIRGTYLENEATFFKPKMAWRVDTVNPDEKKFTVDSGASMR